MKSINRHQDFLEYYNIRPSLQRLAVIDYLLDNNTHPTVDKIYDDLSDKIPTLSKTTIYNILKLFIDAGLVQELTIDGKQNRYDGKVFPHAHFYCKKCEQIFDIPMPEIQEDSVLKMDYHVESTQVYYMGFCKNCKK